jgi:hypothetical protein
MSKPRSDKVRAQDAARQRAATDRKAQRAAELGSRSIKGEIYKATSDALVRIAELAGCEEEIEIIANLIARADELAARDPHAFAALTSHKTLPEVWHG